MKGSSTPARAGDVDTSFGMNGKAVLMVTAGISLSVDGKPAATIPDHADIATSLLTLGADERILGAFTLFVEGAVTGGFVSLASNGDPHPGFGGTGGYILPGNGTKVSGRQVFERLGQSTLFCAKVNIGTIDEGFAVLAIDDDGTLDETFGDRGIVSFIKGDELPRFLGLDIVSADDSHILLTAGALRDGGVIDAAIIRLKPDGSRDPTFNDSGIRWLDEDYQEATMGRRLLAVRQGEYIVVCPETGTRVRRYRFDDGEADLSFGFDGSIELVYPDGDPDSNTVIYAMNIDNRGHLWFAGKWIDPLADVFTYTYGLLVSTDTDGHPSPAFGTGGFKIMKKDSGNLELSYLAQDAEGRILVGGRRMSTIENVWWGVVGRTLSSGDLDPGFGTEGFIDFLDLGNNLDNAPTFMYQPDAGRVLSYNYGTLLNEGTIRAFVT